MDGVIYRGDKLIPGSDYFIQSLLEKEIPFLFLSNNSQRSRCDVVLKIANKKTSRLRDEKAIQQLLKLDTNHKGIEIPEPTRIHQSRIQTKSVCCWTEGKVENETKFNLRSP